MLSDDLLFTSRVTGSANALGLQLKTSRDPSAIERDADLACLLVDLHLPKLEIASFVSETRRRHPRCRIVGYGSHVAVDVLREARQAGCDLVLPRSKFVEDLNRDLPLWFGPGGD